MTHIQMPIQILAENTLCELFDIVTGVTVSLYNLADNNNNNRLVIKYIAILLCACREVCV